MATCISTPLYDRQIVVNTALPAVNLSPTIFSYPRAYLLSYFTYFSCLNAITHCSPLGDWFNKQEVSA